MRDPPRTGRAQHCAQHGADGARGAPVGVVRFRRRLLVSATDRNRGQVAATASYAVWLEAMLSDEPRPPTHQRVDHGPAHTVAAHHRTDRHLLRVADQAMRPSNSPWPSKNRSQQLPQLNRCRVHANTVCRPDTSKSRTSRSRVSCTLWHLNPQCGHRTRVWVDSTRTLNTAGVSMSTPTPRLRAGPISICRPKGSWAGDSSSASRSAISALSAWWCRAKARSACLVAASRRSPRCRVGS